MNAPDKIFVNVDQFGFMHAYDIENHPSCGEEYIRKDLVEHIIRGALGPQDALNKIRSL